MSRRYPPAPVVGVGAIITCGEAVLLIERGTEPARGLWSIPGGAVEVGESLVQACAREALEETGLVVEVGPLVEVVERVLRDGQGRVEYHYVLHDFLCRCSRAEPLAASDAAAARWVEVSDLDGAGLTPLTLKVIHKGLALAG